MANKNQFFTSTHSVYMINLRHVIYAESEGPDGGDVTIYFKNGECVNLEGTDATMFREAWRNHEK